MLRLREWLDPPQLRRYIQPQGWENERFGFEAALQRRVILYNIVITAVQLIPLGLIALLGAAIASKSLVGEILFLLAFAALLILGARQAWRLSVACTRYCRALARRTRGSA